MNGKRAWSGIVFAFVVGVIVGGLIMATLVRTHVVHFIRGGPPRMHRVIGDELTGNLDLTAAQREQVAQILREYELIFRDLGHRSRADVQKTAADMEARIRGILSPEQQARFDENVRRLRDRMKKHEENERREGRREHGRAPSPPPSVGHGEGGQPATVPPADTER